MAAFFYYISELPSNTRGMSDPVYDVASEEIYQDLCALRQINEVFLSCFHKFFCYSEFVFFNKN